MSLGVLPVCLFFVSGSAPILSSGSIITDLHIISRLLPVHNFKGSGRLSCSPQTIYTFFPKNNGDRFHSNDNMRYILILRTQEEIYLYLRHIQNLKVQKPILKDLCYIETLNTRQKDLTPRQIKGKQLARISTNTITLYKQMDGII